MVLAYSISFSMGGMYLIEEWILSVLYHWTHSAVAASTSTRDFHVVRRRGCLISSVLYKPIVDSISALSGASPTLPMEPAIPASSKASMNAIDVYWADSSGRRNTAISRGVALRRTAAWMSTKTGRAPMRSPGRPPRRDVERAFWARIADGRSSEDAAVAVGVSGLVGSRWFRQRGGMSGSLRTGPSSDRYLSFAEREEIALPRVQGAGV